MVWETKAKFFYTRANNLLIIPTSNEIDPSDFGKYRTGESFIEDVISYARRNNSKRVLVACDADFYLKDIDEGFERLKWIYLKAQERHEEIRFVNTSALVYSAYSSEYDTQINLEDFYVSRGITDPIRFVSSWTTSAGNLDHIDHARAYDYKLFLEEWDRKRTAGGNWEKLERARDMWLDNISSTVFYDNREPWRNFLPEHFKENLIKSWNLLHEA